MANNHYVVTSSLQEFAQPSSLQVIADNAYAHYRTRTLAQSAGKFAEMIHPVVPAQAMNTDGHTDISELGHSFPHSPAPFS